MAAGTNLCTHNTALEGIALGIFEALREANSRGWFNIIFESDSKIMVNAIHALIMVFWN
jgi:ribonuclease HI